jgi:hypothetical protein
MPVAHQKGLQLVHNCMIDVQNSERLVGGGGGQYPEVDVNISEVMPVPDVMFTHVFTTYYYDTNISAQEGWDPETLHLRDNCP